MPKAIDIDPMQGCGICKEILDLEPSELPFGDLEFLLPEGSKLLYVSGRGWMLLSYAWDRGDIREYI